MRYRFKFFLLLWLAVVSTITAERIADYNSTLHVHSSGSLDITENILYDFGTASRHGIYRDIPETVKPPGVTRPIDLGFSTFIVRRDRHPEPWERETLYTDGGATIRLKIGDAHRLLTGEHLYTLSYHVAKGVLPASDGSGDAVRWNVLGTGWKVPVDRFRIDVYLPESLHKSMVQVHSWTGGYGSARNEASPPVWVTPRHFYLTARHLAPHEGVTVEVTFPPGSLAQTGAANVAVDPMDRLLDSLPLPLAAAYLAYLWFLSRRYGRESGRGAIAPRYYPPKDLSLLESGLILDRFNNHKDLSAAIVELAALGYLKIYNDKATDAWVQRTSKEEKDLTEDQKYLLDTLLFPSGKKRFSFVEASPDQQARIQNSLTTLDDLLYDWSVRAGYMAENPQKARRSFLFRALAVFIPLTLFFLFIMFRSYPTETLIPFLFISSFVGIGVVLLVSSWRKRAYVGLIFAVIWTGFSSFILFGLMRISDLLQMIFGVPGLLFLTGGALWYLYRKVGSFTREGARMHRYLLGYKEFVTRVEKDRIRRFIKEDPHYLDRSLPYAMLFGVTEAWAGLYSALGLTMPDWYVGEWNDLDDFDQAVESGFEPPASESGGFSGGGSW